MLTLEEFNPALVGKVADCDVVGLERDYVLHYNADDGTLYNTGLTLQDWLDGHSESWAMLEEEAERVGIKDYDAYITRLREMNPDLFSGFPAFGTKPG